MEHCEAMCVQYIGVWSIVGRTMYGCVQVFVDDLMLRGGGMAGITIDELRDACDVR